MFYMLDINFVGFEGNRGGIEGEERGGGGERNLLFIGAIFVKRL